MFDRIYFLESLKVWINTLFDSDCFEKFKDNFDDCFNKSDEIFKDNDDDCDNEVNDIFEKMNIRVER